MVATRASRQRVTSADVARDVGLSRTTVSYVLNDTPHQTIPETTRRRVLEAAARLGYAPSAAARTLRSGRSDVVLCLLPDWPIGVVLGRFLESLSLELGRGGLTLLTHPASAEDRSVIRVLSAITPAAVVSFKPFDAPAKAVIESSAIPVSVVLADPGGRGRLRGIDQRAVGRRQVEHLVDRGHRHLGFASPDDPRVQDFFLPRLEGVRAGCADLGLAPPVVCSVAFDVDLAARAVTEWSGGQPPVTAVCAYNDEVAFAVLAGMRRLGLRAPDDIAVIGVDDIPSAPLADPPLTTIEMDQALVAKYVADSVVALLAERPLPRHPGIRGIRLRIRESA